MNEPTKVLLLYIRVGLEVLSARIVLILALSLTFSLFCWAMWGSNWERIACAAIFAVLVFLPATRIDAAQSKNRAVISPKEPEDG